MELKEFIAETIQEIVDGALNARERLSSSGTYVIPEMTPLNDLSSDQILGFAGTLGRKDMPVYAIEFDVAVTLTQESGKRGTVGVLVAAMGIGGQATSQQSDTQHSRIKFIIPVAFPPLSVPFKSK